MKRDAKIEFFEKNITRLNEDDQRSYKNQEKQLISDEIFIRKKLEGLQGVIEFINENDVQKNCVTNLSKGRVPEEKNMVIDRIGIKYGYSVTLVDAALVNYTQAMYSLNDTEFDAGAVATGGEVYAQKIPLAFRNAEYELKHDGGIIDRGRICDLLTDNVTVDGVNGNRKNFQELEWCKMLLAGKRLELNIKFPEGGTVPAGNHYMELVLKGIGLSKRQS